MANKSLNFLTSSLKGPSNANNKKRIFCQKTTALSPTYYSTTYVGHKHIYVGHIGRHMTKTVYRTNPKGIR